MQLINNINDIKLFKDYKNVNSYIDNQLVYLYHSTNSGDTQDSNKILLKENIKQFCLNGNDQLNLSILILKSFQSFLTKQVKIVETSSDNSNNQLINIDIALLYIYKWLISGLIKNKIINTKKEIDQKSQSEIVQLVLEIISLSIKSLDIPEFLKTIEEQKQFNEKKEFTNSVKQSIIFKSKILIVFQIIYKLFKSEIYSSTLLNFEIRNTILNQLFFRLLEYKIISAEEEKEGGDSDIILKHWTNLEISNYCNKIMKPFQQYHNCKYEFINNQLDYFKWSRTSFETHFKLLSSNENESRWKYNTPLVHSFNMFIHCFNGGAELFDMFYTSSNIQFHRFILAIIYNLLDCTLNDIKFIGIDLIGYFVNKLQSNTHIKSIFIIDSSSFNNDSTNTTNIYNKLYDLLKQFDCNIINSIQVEKCTNLLFNLLFILFPLDSSSNKQQDVLIHHPQISIRNESNTTATSNFNINFIKYQDLLNLLISILIDPQYQLQIDIQKTNVKKLMLLNQFHQRVFQAMSLNSVQFFKKLIPALLSTIEISSLKTDQQIILSILHCLDELIKYCWPRIVNSNYSSDIIKSISPLLYNNEKDIYTDLVLSIFDKLSGSFKKLDQHDKFLNYININFKNNEFILNKYK